MRQYGIQSMTGRWVQWVTLDARRDNGAATVGWTGDPRAAWTSSEREAKALATLVADTEENSLRVKPPLP